MTNATDRAQSAEPFNAESSKQSLPELIRALTLLWLAGVMLRLTILALPPVLNEIAMEFSLRGSDIGMLAAIPPLLFAVAAIPGAILISRVGPVAGLLVGLLLNALGAAARGFTQNVVQLELATAVMCLGVAVMQPAMPMLARTWTPTRIGLASATYTCGLLCGEVLPFLLQFPLDLPWMADGWRKALVQWSLPVLATVVAILVARPTVGGELGTVRAKAWPEWRSDGLWKIGILLGAVNAAYFGLNGFLPGWLAANPGNMREALLALNAAQIPAALLLMIIVERVVFVRSSYVIGGLLVLVGSIGLAALPAHFAVLMACIAGFSLAFLLTLALALPPLIADPADVPSLSAGIFTVSYFTAVLTILGTGALADSTSDRALTILPIAAAAVAVMGIGMTIYRPSREQSERVHRFQE
jgi:CP family cyanate transporter-like MFS transporter